MTAENEGKAEGRIHEQKNPDGSVSNYDDTGDEVKKNNNGEWVKDDKSASSTETTTSVEKSKSTT